MEYFVLKFFKIALAFIDKKHLRTLIGISLSMLQKSHFFY